ncbi:MAG: hypothetical protein ACRDTT_17845, partial [Pseudonocardiaceae bacterium]
SSSGRRRRQLRTGDGHFHTGALGDSAITFANEAFHGSDARVVRADQQRLGGDHVGASEVDAPLIARSCDRVRRMASVTLVLLSMLSRLGTVNGLDVHAFVRGQRAIVTSLEPSPSPLDTPPLRRWPLS